MLKAEIGIFGGSGFYKLLDRSREIKIDTPYGQPSANFRLGKINNRSIAFLPRHGDHHQFPPHKIPYRANLWAMKKLGVEIIIAPSACGSLQTQIKPGDFVLCDQFVDRTYGREDTFYDQDKTAHISAAYPYCPNLRQIADQTCQTLKIKIHPQGTVVVINGPRFSTKAESRWYSNQGWEVINMTQYPEVILAKELEMCYLNIALITDYDAGLEGLQDIQPVTLNEVIRVFNQNNLRVKKLITSLIPKLPRRRVCACAKAMEGAFVN